MSTVKISELPVATPIQGADLVPIVQSGVTKQATANQVRDLAGVISVSGLVGYWPLNGFPTVSGYAFDLSGTENHGTRYGGIIVDGILGKALSFNGSTDYVLLDKTKFTHTGAFSFAVWVQGKARSAIQYLLMRDTGTGDGGRGLRCYIDASNRPRFLISGNGNNVVAFSADAGSECTSDCFLEFVFNPSISMQIYKNGVLIKEYTTSIPALVFYSAAMVMEIGRFTGGYNFDGWMQGAVLFNRALSAEECYSLYANKGLYLDCLTKATTPVPYSYAIRDANGIVELATMTPTTSSGTGIVGQMAYDASYVYVCTAANTWKRVAITTW